MKLNFNENIGSGYRSSSQIARVMTETWISDNMYCPRCGCEKICHFENNKPVADFYCSVCKNEYELKSKNGNLGRKINDGAYDTMISRITSNNNPDFFFMSYSKHKSMVKDIILIPKHFFVPEVIEKRKPLAKTARRAGWVGCNILIDKIPKQGRIDIITDGKIADVNSVVKKVNRSQSLLVDDMGNRGWLLDVLFCMNSLKEQFTLNEMYSFEQYLKLKHPDNNNIKPKIRQQLQFLRDKGFVEFLGNGNYKKVI